MVDLHKILAGENRLPVLPGKRIVRHEGGRADVSILVDVQHIAVLRRPGAQQQRPRRRGSQRRQASRRPFERDLHIPHFLPMTAGFCRVCHQFTMKAMSNLGEIQR